MPKEKCLLCKSWEPNGIRFPKPGFADDGRSLAWAANLGIDYEDICAQYAARGRLFICPQHFDLDTDYDLVGVEYVRRKDALPKNGTRIERMAKRTSEEMEGSSSKESAANEVDEPAALFRAIPSERGGGGAPYRAQRARGKESRNEPFLNEITKTKVLGRKRGRPRKVLSDGLGEPGKRASTDGGAFDCDVCKRSLNSAQALHYHRKTHSQHLKCEPCAKDFATKDERSEHFKLVHGIFECASCAMTFKLETGLANHRWRLHGDAPPPNLCPQCFRSFKTPGALRLHLATHLNPFPCPLCEIVFESKAARKAHFVEVHRADCSSTAFMCTRCGATFSNVYNLRAHLMKTVPCTELDGARQKEKFSNSHMSEAECSTSSTEFNPKAYDENEFSASNFVAKKQQQFASSETNDGVMNIDNFVQPDEFVDCVRARLENLGCLLSSAKLDQSKVLTMNTDISVVLACAERLAERLAAVEEENTQAHELIEELRQGRHSTGGANLEVSNGTEIDEYYEHHHDGLADHSPVAPLAEARMEQILAGDVSDASSDDFHGLK